MMSPPIEEDEELERLRIAALKTLFTRKKRNEEAPEISHTNINSSENVLNHVPPYYTAPPPTYSDNVLPVTSTLPPVPQNEITRRNRGFGRMKFANKRGRGFERHRFNSNLIAIVPVDENELSSTSTDSKPSMSQKSNDVPKLVLPQDRFYKTDKEKPVVKTTTESTKFSRFDDSSDESDELDFEESFLSADEEEETKVNKADISDDDESFEKVISELEAAVQGNINIISNSELSQETSSAEDDLKPPESVLNDDKRSASVINSLDATSNKELSFDKSSTENKVPPASVSDDKKHFGKNILSPDTNAKRLTDCEVRTVRLLSPKANLSSLDICSPPPSKFARLKSPSPDKLTRLDSPSPQKSSKIESRSPHKLSIIKSPLKSTKLISHSPLKSTPDSLSPSESSRIDLFSERKLLRLCSDSPQKVSKVTRHSSSRSPPPHRSSKLDSLSPQRSPSPKEKNEDSMLTNRRSSSYKSTSPREKSPASSFSMTFSSSRSDSSCSDRSASPDNFKRTKPPTTENSPKNVQTRPSSLRFSDSRMSARNMRRDRSRSPLPSYRRSPYRSPLLRARERKQQNVDKTSDNNSVINGKFSRFPDKPNNLETVNNAEKTSTNNKDLEDSVTFHRRDKRPERRFRVKGRPRRSSYTSSDSNEGSPHRGRLFKSGVQSSKYKDNSNLYIKKNRSSLSPQDHSPRNNKRNIRSNSRHDRRRRDVSPLKNVGVRDIGYGSESNSIPDPVLEARKRKFESNQPVVPTEKKIKLKPAINENIVPNKEELETDKLYEEEEIVNKDLSVKNRRPTVSEWDEVDYDLFDQGSVASGWSDDDEPNINIHFDSALAREDLKVHIEATPEERDEDKRSSDGKKHKSPSKDKHKKSKKSKKKEKRTAELFKQVEDLRAELSRRRAERLGKSETAFQDVGPTSRLIKSAFQSVVSDKISKKSKKKKHKHEKSDYKASKKAEKRRVMLLNMLEEDSGRMLKFPVNTADKRDSDESPPWASKGSIHRRLGFSGDRSGRRDVEGTSEVGNRSKHVSLKV